MSAFTDFLTKQGLGAVSDATGKFALNDATKDKLKETGKSLLKKGAAAGAAAKLADTTYKAQQSLIDKQKDFSNRNLQKYGGMAKNLQNQIMGGAFDSDKMAKAASDQISVAEQGRQSALDQAAKAGGDVVSALRSGDPRAMALAPGMIGQTQTAVNEANQASAQAKARAGAGLADYDAAQKGKQQAFANTMFDTAKGLELGAEQDLQQAGMDETQLKANRMIDAATNFQAFNQQAKSNEDTQGQNTGTDTDTPPPPPPPLVPDPENEEEEEELASNNAKGGRIKAKAGMKYMGEQGFVTKGEFSHKTNKKAVIDEENGEKEAELTGGEFVFNPKQTSAIERLVDKNNEKGLLKFMRELLNKPQFKK